MKDSAKKKFCLIVGTNLGSEALAIHTVSELWQNLVV